MLAFILYPVCFQLGVDGADCAVGGSLLSPSRVKLDAPACAITCGSYHNLALMSSGDVYSWGFGDSLALRILRLTA